MKIVTLKSEPGKFFTPVGILFQCWAFQEVRKQPFTFFPWVKRWVPQGGSYFITPDPNDFEVVK